MEIFLLGIILSSTKYNSGPVSAEDIHFLAGVHLTPLEVEYLQGFQIPNTKENNKIWIMSSRLKSTPDKQWEQMA